MKNRSAPKTGIPRSSKLPVPKASLTLRTATSRESLTAGETRTSRLRQSMSREQLNSTSRPETANSTNRITSAERPKSTITAPKFKPPVSIPRGRTGEHSSISSPRNSSTSRSIYTPSDSRSISRAAPTREPEHEESKGVKDEPLSKKRSTVLTRRPSETWGKSPYVPPPVTTTSRPPSRVSRSSAGTDPTSPVESYSRDQSVTREKSLAERTAETLQQVSSSPRLKRQPSNFFDQYNLLSPTQDRTSRPASRQSSNGDPGSPLRGPPMTGFRGAKPRSLAGTGGGVPAALRQTKTCQSLGSPDPQDPAAAFKTLPVRPLKHRASTNGLFRQPSLQNMKNPYDAPRRVSSISIKSPMRTVAPPQAPKPEPTPEEEESKAKKSSNALREQIAAARAAAKKATAEKAAAPVTKIVQSVESTQEDEIKLLARMGRARTGTVIHNGKLYDFDPNHEDPFNQRRSQEAKNKILLGRLAGARSTGRLNIAALGLQTIPVEILRMYDISMFGDQAVSWGSSVDVTKFVAADNELESIGDDIFPDKDLNDYTINDEGSDNIFGALETLDFHGNMLVTVPMGLRRLCNLTSLDLSSNRISNDTLDIISQITSLRDLKLAKNLLYGPMPANFADLINLEVLDIHGNNVSALPADIGKMNRLRMLNISENSFESLPFETLSQLPLNEINASKNMFSGVLIEGKSMSFPLMQILDLSCNRITHLVEDECELSFPSLHQLTLSANKLKGLPNMMTWTNLMTLAVDENAIPEIPQGFTSLMKLRHVDFSSNNVRIISPEVSAMDSLMMIKLSGNPLRDKKFATITTEELKGILSDRMEPPPTYHTLGSNPNAKVEDMERSETPDTVIGPEDASYFPSAQTPPAKVGTSASDLATIMTPETQKQPADFPDIGQDVETQEAKVNIGDGLDGEPQPMLIESPAVLTNVPTRACLHTVGSQQNWPVKPGGILDGSRTESSSLHPVVCADISSTNCIKEVQLHHNLFYMFPKSLSFFADTLTLLSLSHNLLVGEEYIGEVLELPALRELNLMSNKITSLAPLVAKLHAPSLEKLDASMNRINALPTSLRTTFPKLTVLQLANNYIVDLEPDAIMGMKIVDVSNNDIALLNPKLGLLGGSNGLQRLELTGNRFRVPRWNVIERGTEATLRWLRGRVPAAEKAAWKEVNADGSDQDTD